MSSEEPDCTRCRHYYVTWEEEHPHGCHAYGFKSPSPPTLVILRESGNSCRLFEPKDAQGPEVRRVNRP